MTAEPARPAVVDASLVLAWVLPGEAGKHALGLRDRARDHPDLLLLAPPTFWYEVANALWAAVRRRRLDRGQAAEALDALQAFSVELWTADPANCLELALQQGVAVYDAAYLAVALEGGGALWTLDGALAGAARALGLAVEPH